MKKKLFLLPVALLAFSLVGCGNQQVFDTNWSFEKVHVFSENKCYKITSWRDFDDGDQIQVKMENYGAVLFHANQIALIENKCPFCGG